MVLRFLRRFSLLSFEKLSLLLIDDLWYCCSYWVFHLSVLMRSFFSLYKISIFLLILTIFLGWSSASHAAVCSISTPTVITQTYINNNSCTSIDIEGSVSTTWLGTTDLSGGTVTVKNGYTMTMGSSSAMVLGATDDLVIESGATVTHRPEDSNGVQITARNISVLGSVNVSDKGCSGVATEQGRGPDLTTGTCSGGTAGYGKSRWGGASHGGTGGTYGEGAATVLYGDQFNPTYLGSSGGGGSGSEPGGSGGGRVRLIATQTLTISGSVLANATMTGIAGVSGAGSGGSIYLQASTLVLSGSVQANGGTGIEQGAGGGGGRVAIYYATDGGISPQNVTARKGVRGGDNAQGTAGDGSNGTAFLLDRTSDDGAGTIYVTGGIYVSSTVDLVRQQIYAYPGALFRCMGTGGALLLEAQTINLNSVDWICSNNYSSVTVSSTQLLSMSSSTMSFSGSISNVSLLGHAGIYSTSTIWTFSNLDTLTLGATSTWIATSSTVSNTKAGSRTFFQGPSSLTFTNFVFYGAQNHGTSNALSALTFTDTVGLTLTQSSHLYTSVSSTIASLSISSNSSISASGKGCAGTTDDVGRGPSETTGVCASSVTGYGPYRWGGGGHGGSGGNYGEGAGSTYGSSASPSLVGSSGGGGAGTAGANGGGRIRLNITGALSNSGTISAAGQSASVLLAQSAGSGGSIWITSGSISGSGTYTVAGGTGSQQGAGGGGGRMNVSFSSGASTTATFDVSGGAGGEFSGGSGAGQAGSFLSVLLNQSPSTPSSLGPTALVNGSTTGTNTPTFSFTLSDPDVADTVKYRIQIDNSSDFSSPVVDYTSALAAQGARTFQVGQVSGSGSYSVGSSGQTLSDGSYYWRVKTVDANAVESSYTTANSGAIAFIVDGTVPTVQFAQATASALESVTATSVRILLSAAHFETVTVNYALTGTATGGGTDYTLADGTATIPIGNTTATIDLVVVDDAMLEGSETVVFTLSSPSQATLGSNTSLTYSITDNDTAGVTLSVSALTVTEGNTAGSYTVVLTSQPTSTVQIALTSSLVVADASPSTLSFTSSNWSTPQTVTVAALDDTSIDGSQTMIITHTISASTASGYPQSTNVGTVTVTVLDNDGPSSSGSSGGGGGATSGSSGSGLGTPVTWTFIQPVQEKPSVVDPPISSPVPPLSIPPSTSPITTILNLADPLRIAELLNDGQRNLTRETQALTRVQQDLRTFRLDSTEETRIAHSVFLAYGASDVTARLGMGEREALLRDAYETMRTSRVSVTDLERMARGVVPETRNLAQERVQLPRVRQTFRTIYGHEPDFRNPEENLAWNTLMYRIRFPRDLTAERQGIVEFRRLFGRDPRDPFQWSTVRVLGYVR